MNQPKLFDPLTVNLAGTNLIEASAGTGKTYSIGILFLRLILEKRLTVKEILMVTFTKAAVAELEQRIRLFVRNAYKVTTGEEIDDPVITALVKQQADIAEARKLLHSAVLYLDETSVLTIHSFCQKVLSEFAFETNQLFNAETLQDSGTVLDAATNKFWRTYITVIPPELLQHLINGGLSRQKIKGVVQDHVAGKRYYPYCIGKNYTADEGFYLNIIPELQKLKEKVQRLTETVLNYLNSNKDWFVEKLNNNGSARRYFKQELLDYPAELHKEINAKRDKKYIEYLFEDVFTHCDDCAAAEEEVSEYMRQIIYHINCNAINLITESIKNYKDANNQMSFDDMILNLHEALVTAENEVLANELRKKYKAVFIDEFQDTDRLQYELFRAAFSTDTIVFYIGDPKQSIYAFRKADIFTYFKAYEEVDNMYNMNINFRSSGSLIDAMNIFFKPDDAFDTFYFGTASHAIKYIPVHAPVKSAARELRKGKKACVPITITELPNNGAIEDAVVAQVIDLLSAPNYETGEISNSKNIFPSDIGILVSSNRQGRNIQSLLSTKGIPAVTIGDEKVLQSEEAKYVLYLLEAMAEVSRASVNKALLSPFTGFTVKDIIHLDDEKAVSLFKKYKVQWDTDGIYTALTDFIFDYNVQQKLLRNADENGERIIANLYQLIELLHKVQTTKVLSAPELINWLKRATEGMETEGDEYEQRVESDEDAVKIVTVHKSKGLEYKIVLLPFLDLQASNTFDNASYRDPESGDYISFEQKCLSAEQEALRRQQREQENRRIIYVAITRAVYKCFIYRNKYYSTSSLTAFTDNYKIENTALIEKGAALNIPTNYRFAKESWKPAREAKAVNFSLAMEDWTKLSYSTLKSDINLHSLGAAKDQENSYDHFVFKSLTRGAKTGNMLHYIFENINYNDKGSWGKVIAAAIRRYAPDQLKTYEKALPEIIGQVLQAKIATEEVSFSMAEIDYAKRIHEFEFDFPLSHFSVADLASISDEEIQLSVNPFGYAQGIMNGKIDLFFEHAGKYYVLDWKSNYLGDSISDYSSDSMAKAMNDNNYHLQYLIYTVAVKKYLTSRLPAFDYEKDFGGVLYLFIRGMREGADSGVFYCKPAFEKIERLEEMLCGTSVGA